MSIYAVIDTNVLVSALLKRNSNPGNVVLNVLAGIVKPVYSQAILAEYKEVLSRKKFSFSKQTIHSVIQKITKNGTELSGIQTDEKPSDPKDVIFYEVTMDSRQTEDTFLVTGNGRDFPAQPFVVTPEEMLRIIAGKRTERAAENG